MKKIIVIVCILYIYGLCATPIFTIVPKEGTTLPAEVITGYDVQAYYTITNNTTRNLSNLYVSNLPVNVSQITAENIYPDACGAIFNLAAGASCTLELNVAGPTHNDQIHYLFVSLPGGMTGSGTEYPLNVIESAWEPISVSYEIIYIGSIGEVPNSFVLAYKEGGSNPINGTEWEAYEPPTGYLKNTTRYLQFEESIYITSPGDLNGQQTYIQTSDGYTWFLISNAINAMWPIEPYNPVTDPFLAGDLITTPLPGTVKVSANYKAQLMKFYACEHGIAPGTPGAIPILRYFIYDQWGNKYIMHASDYPTPDEVTAAFDAAILPAGWTKSPEYLTEDFILYPAQGADNTYEYTLVRDDQNNTYHQMYWSPEGGTTVTSQIQGSGMPIWGGKNNDVLTVNNGYNNIVYGGGGVNQYYFPALTNTDEPNTGINTIIGFNSTAGETLNFAGQDYTYVLTQAGVEITVGSDGLVVILSGRFNFNPDWVIS